MKTIAHWRLLEGLKKTCLSFLNEAYRKYKLPSLHPKPLEPPCLVSLTLSLSEPLGSYFSYQVFCVFLCSLHRKCESMQSALE